jgi:hypothetical protein
LHGTIAAWFPMLYDVQHLPIRPLNILFQYQYHQKNELAVRYGVAGQKTFKNERAVRSVIFDVKKNTFCSYLYIGGKTYRKKTLEKRT